MSLTPQEIQRFTEINTKIRNEEIRARKLYLDLRPKLDKMVEDNIISDYEIEEHYSFFSFDENFCKSKNVELGNPFLEYKTSNFIQTDDNFFNTNWNELNWSKKGTLKDLHFGYTMHCELFHADHDLWIEDILATDDFWYELDVLYQFNIEE